MLGQSVTTLCPLSVQHEGSLFFIEDLHKDSVLASLTSATLAFVCKIHAGVYTQQYTQNNIHNSIHNDVFVHYAVTV